MIRITPTDCSFTSGNLVGVRIGSRDIPPTWCFVILSWRQCTNLHYHLVRGRISWKPWRRRPLPLWHIPVKERHDFDHLKDRRDYRIWNIVFIGDMTFKYHEPDNIKAVRPWSRAPVISAFISRLAVVWTSLAALCTSGRTPSFVVIFISELQYRRSMYKTTPSGFFYFLWHPRPS